MLRKSEVEKSEMHEGHRSQVAQLVEDHEKNAEETLRKNTKMLKAEKRKFQELLDRSEIEYRCRRPTLRS